MRYLLDWVERNPGMTCIFLFFVFIIFFISLMTFVGKP